MADYSKMIIAADAAHRLTNNQERAIRQALKAIESPAFKAMQELQGNSSVGRMIANIDRNKFLVRGTQGLVAELHRSGVFDQAHKYAEQLALALAAMETYGARISLPRLLPQFSPLEFILTKAGQHGYGHFIRIVCHEFSSCRT